ncbi:AT-hook motif nuclear-localized protein 27-like [Impatiens glandulifera]|uniref:AT-hook motif nuclear-localized protein 27-like n=1 Tax=Impatiens glandulifera TaxID=253017 RepID=UPI001FB17FA8|nr:AT-hook motif nuclear-localized protein 27-like [Impatiens glandulifera]
MASGNSSHRQFLHPREFLGPQVDLHLQAPFSVPQPTAEDHSSDSNKELSPEKTHPITRRSRGRPAGSKNKPTPPTVITRDNPNSLRAHILEVSIGNDIIESLLSYAQKRGRGVSIIGGNGSVSNVTLRQTAVGPNAGGVVSLQGRFELLSLKGTVLPPPAPPGAGGLSVFLAGGQGQVVGGIVMGPLIAASTVVLMAASFANAVFERLSLDPEEEVQPDESSGVTTGGGGGGGSLFNVPNYFSGDHQLSGWGGNGAARPSF